MQANDSGDTPSGFNQLQLAALLGRRRRWKALEYFRAGQHIAPASPTHLKALQAAMTLLHPFTKRR